MITKRQRDLLAYLAAKAANGDQFPTFAEIVADKMANQKSDAHRIITRLCELKLVERLPGAHRRPYRVTARGIAYVQNPQGTKQAESGDLITEARLDGVRVMGEELRKCFLNWESKDRTRIGRFIERAAERAGERLAAANG